MSTLSQLPRTVVKAYFSAARLPIDAVARIRGQQDNEQWPPALAFEGLEAGVETVLGSLLRDDRLVETGRLRQAKVAQLRKAAQLGTLADVTRAEAREEFSERRERAEERRREAARRTNQREQQIEREAEQAKEKVEQRAAKQAAAAGAQEAAAEQVIERRERAATAGSLAKEAEALETREAALQASEKVEAIDEAIDDTREGRKMS